MEARRQCATSSALRSVMAASSAGVEFARRSVIRGKCSMTESRPGSAARHACRRGWEMLEVAEADEARRQPGHIRSGLVSPRAAPRQRNQSRSARVVGMPSADCIALAAFADRAAQLPGATVAATARVGRAASAHELDLQPAAPCSPSSSARRRRAGRPVAELVTAVDARQRQRQSPAQRFAAEALQPVRHRRAAAAATRAARRLTDQPTQCGAGSEGVGAGGCGRHRPGPRIS